MKKKDTSIFVYPAHCDGKHVPGVDYVRIIRPMEELSKQKGFKVKIFDGKDVLYWKELAQEYDIFYLNYITNAPGFVSAAFWFMKYGKKIVFDIDDLIWEIQPDNASYSVYAPKSEGRAVITDIIARGVDYVTCTNQYLKHGIAQYTDKDNNKIKVLPNYIDLDLYKWRKKPKDDYEITIGYFGSSSHFNDLVNPGFLEGMTKLMADYPQVRFFTIGAMIQEIKKRFGARYTTGFGDHDIYKWVEMMPEICGNIDIFVAPLLEIPYTKGKSGIKYLEYSSTKIPGVYQDIRQYQELVEDGKNGYLAKTKHDWYKKLKGLVESVKLRKTIGEAAFKTVKDNHTFEKNVKLYVDLFNSI